MSENRDARWNEAVLLGQGVASTAGDELTSVRLVLPFLYTTVGAPIFFAGLLVPAATIAKRLSQILAAPIVSVARSNTRLIGLALLVLAAGIVFVSLTFNVVDAFWVVPIFLFVALVVGGATGLRGLAYQNLIGRALPGERRHRLLFTQSSIAGLFVVIVALGTQYLLRPGTSTAAHQELIWVGAGLFLLAALLVALVREPAKSNASADAATRETRVPLRESFRVAFKLPWFGRFLIARSLYLSIELAIPFFSIHAATFHGDSVGGLNAFVVATSIGVMLGGFLWSWIGRRSVGRIMLFAAALTCLAGVLAMAIEFNVVTQNIFCYALVFVLVALGAQGVKNGRTLYLIGMTEEAERPFCIAVANVTIGMVAIAVGALLGALAGLKGVAWPIGALIVLNAAAALYTLTLPAQPENEPMS